MSPRRLTLVAGSGNLATVVAGAARAGGEPLQVIDIVGRNDLAADVIEHIPLIRAADVVAAIRNFRTTHLVLAGAVHISDAEREGLAKAHGLGGWAAKRMGDIGLAGAILLYYRMHGIKLVGAQSIAPGLLAPDGPIAGPLLDGETRRWAQGALQLAKKIGTTDLGQSVVVSGTRPVAAEDAGGTDALMLRVGALRAAGLTGNGSTPLILAKALKPRQPRFADLPAIGRQTILNAAEAGISVVVVETGKSLVLEREALEAAAAAHSISVVGLAL